MKDTEETEENDGVRLVLNQVAEKDVEFHLDSEIVFEVCDGQMVMRTTVYTSNGPISGTRQFSLYNLDDLQDPTPNPSRRPSYCPSATPSRRASMSVTPNPPRRGSISAPQQPFLRRSSADFQFGTSLLAPQFAARRPSIDISYHE